MEVAERYKRRHAGKAPTFWLDKVCDGKQLGLCVRFPPAPPLISRPHLILRPHVRIAAHNTTIRLKNLGFPSADKVCIDQNNIRDGLKVLPVNVMACNKMLVLCGETYVQRLWCAWELFTLFSFQSH